MNRKLVELVIAISFFVSYTLGVKAQGGMATVPYTCDFENALERSQWVFVNGSQPNKWCVDTATDNGGQYSLYISSDGGASHRYNATMTSRTWAYRQIALASGLYNISYDWKAQGYATSHYMRAYLVPATMFNVSAGDSTGFRILGSPSGWIPLNPGYPVGGVMNQQSNWQNVFVGNLSVPAAGNYCLVFGWTNDSNSTPGLQPPAAVDNIQITSVTCLPPANLSVIATSVPGNVRVMWQETGSASMWLLEYSMDSTFRQGVRSNFLDLNNANLYFDPQSSLVTLSGPAGLQPGASYYFRLRALCDTSAAYGDTSMFSNVFAFNSVSIGAYAEQADVVLHPNPASDKVFVQLDGTDVDEIRVLDIYGRLVKRIASAEGKQAIDLQGFAKGLYFVQVRNAGTVVATRKLIKK